MVKKIEFRDKHKDLGPMHDEWRVASNPAKRGGPVVGPNTLPNNKEKVIGQVPIRTVSLDQQYGDTARQNIRKGSK